MEERAAIAMETNGPYVVTGPVTLVDADGRRYDVPSGKTVRLCRCGHSATKPFCDSSHRRVDFVSKPSFLPED